MSLLLSTGPHGCTEQGPSWYSQVETLRQADGQCSHLVTLSRTRSPLPCCTCGSATASFQASVHKTALPLLHGQIHHNCCEAAQALSLTGCCLCARCWKAVWSLSQVPCKLQSKISQEHYAAPGLNDVILPGLECCLLSLSS